MIAPGDSDRRLAEMGATSQLIVRGCHQLCKPVNVLRLCSLLIAHLYKRFAGSSAPLQDALKRDESFMAAQCLLFGLGEACIRAWRMVKKRKKHKENVGISQRQIVGNGTHNSQTQASVNTNNAAGAIDQPEIQEEWSESESGDDSHWLDKSFTDREDRASDFAWLDEPDSTEAGTSGENDDDGYDDGYDSEYDYDEETDSEVSGNEEENINSAHDEIEKAHQVELWLASQRRMTRVVQR